MDRRLRRSDLPVDTVALACFLIGKILVHDLRGQRTSGRIVEVEAYPVGDPAWHAFGGKTQRIKGAKVFAACNEITRLSRPLQSRFRRLHLPPYREEQFLLVCTKVLPRLKIASVIWKVVATLAFRTLPSVVFNHIIA
jgi:Methylpurine-DNA glycosylase (MPG)